jgi:uncharacterized protein YcgI (DUF1989 family)
MNVVLDVAGRLTVLPQLSVAGSFIEFQSQLDLIVRLTACSAEQSNNGSFKPIRYENTIGFDSDLSTHES